MIREKDQKLFSQYYTMARIKPSDREKKRYIVFEIISEAHFSAEEVKNAIKMACLRYLGELGTAKLNLYFINNLYRNNKGIIRVANKETAGFRDILSRIDEIRGRKAGIKTTGMSGILKKARNKFLIKEQNH